MSWTNILYETYENKYEKKGNEKLPPPNHIKQKVDIEITIDIDGNFISAKDVNKYEADTIMPVTEEAINRPSTSVNKRPFPLCDFLPFLAGDYVKFCAAADIKEIESSKEKYANYMLKLSKWAGWSGAHPKIKSIYQYLKKAHLIEDLRQSKIKSVKINKDGYFSGTYKRKRVRFSVIDSALKLKETWLDHTIFDNFNQYYEQYIAGTLKGERGFCYITGAEEALLLKKHMKIENCGNAKLISSDDKENFVYSGRFLDAEQCYSMSADASLKIFNTLNWLADEQGVRIGTATYICWSSGENNISEFWKMWNDDLSSNESRKDNYQKKLKDIFRGFRNLFNPTDKIVLLGYNGTSTGRVSIIYYSEQNAVDFLKRVDDWLNTLCWKFYKYDFIPSFRNIICCAFGVEKKNKKTGKLEIALDMKRGKEKETSNQKLYKMQFQRLVKCMIDQQRFPFDLLSALVCRVSNPLLYKWEKGKSENWELVLSVTCAVIVKYKKDHGLLEKEDMKVMKLDESNSNRSYLFGRLLAIYEKAESDTYAKEEKRMTNAMRLQSAFVNHPMQTWKALEDLITPYFQKLKPSSVGFYKGVIDNIAITFSDDDSSVMNRPLREDYLLGYYLQRAELYKNPKKEKGGIKDGDTKK